MRINNISSIPHFGMRLTRELEKGFETAKEEIKDFYGEESEEYSQYCYNLRIIKEKSPNYVVGIGYCEDIYSPYYFKMRHENYREEFSAGNFDVAHKDGLFTPSSLKWLALEAISRECADKKALEDAQKPKKTGVYARFKEKIKPIKRHIVSIWRVDKFGNLVDKKLAENDANAKAGIDNDLNFYKTGMYPNGKTPE